MINDTWILEPIRFKIDHIDVNSKKVSTIMEGNLTNYAIILNDRRQEVAEITFDDSSRLIEKYIIEYVEKNGSSSFFVGNSEEYEKIKACLYIDDTPFICNITLRKKNDEYIPWSVGFGTHLSDDDFYLISGFYIRPHELQMYDFNGIILNNIRIVIVYKNGYVTP